LSFDKIEAMVIVSLKMTIVVVVIVKVVLMMLIIIVKMLILNVMIFNLMIVLEVSKARPRGHVVVTLLAP